jgi:RNA polymerase sigma factor (sigma-70 family)
LALVLRAVRDYKQSGIPLDDLVQEGNLGLIRAAQTFDPSVHTARFATYAKFWIRASIVRALASNGSLIQLPERLRIIRLQFRRAIEELCNRVAVGNDASSSRPPSLDEIARHMGVSSSRLKGVGLTQCDRTLRFGVGEPMMADIRSPDQDVVEKEIRALVYVALRRLSPFEAWVIRERYGLGEPSPREGNHIALRRRTRIRDAAGGVPVPGFSGAAPVHERHSRSFYRRTYMEIGHDCGLSFHRVRQVEKAALEKLRGLLGPHLVAAM